MKNDNQLLTRREAVKALLIGSLATALAPTFALAEEEQLALPSAEEPQQEPSADATEEPAEPDIPSSPTLSISVIASGKTKATQGADGEKLGSTSGSSELARLSAAIGGVEGGVSYKVYTKGKGWVSAKNGEAAGSKSKPILAVSFKLAGAVASTHNIYYRVYIKNKGWLGWAKDGAKCGASSTTWRGIKAIQVKLVKKGAGAPGSTKGTWVKEATKDQLLGILAKASSKKKLQLLGGADFDLDSKTGKALKTAIKNVERVSTGGVLSFCMVDLTTGEGISYAGGQTIYGASCMKGPYIASLNKYKPSSRSQRGGNMRTIIVESNNELYLNLRRNVYGSDTMKKFMKYCKVKSWSYGKTFPFVPCKDLARMWVGCYWYFYKDTNKNSQWCRELYTHGNQSFIYQAFKGKYKVHAKPGWYPGGRGNVQNDSGIVMANGKPYLLTIMSGACGRFTQLRALARALDSVHNQMVK